jgi:hypothetical protein
MCGPRSTIPPPRVLRPQTAAFDRPLVAIVNEALVRRSLRGHREAASARHCGNPGGRYASARRATSAAGRIRAALECPTYPAGRNCLRLLSDATHGNRHLLLALGLTIERLTADPRQNWIEANSWLTCRHRDRGCDSHDARCRLFWVVSTCRVACRSCAKRIVGRLASVA